ncbi:hypothetical protein P691DRAFT_779190 [Macrolepiota fuliginosa MF-IS2]|uniref:Uncharacterized protein n=1 Tax=Macrolepiota fuliginosa MF-IS2 TaxID=1400762 RepID=A0A9P5X3A9_9AGAR|nr:hypothetical protein P691DRAFT_779190 [Macrolepiota fuliginosa MF-IS2]
MPNIDTVATALMELYAFRGAPWTWPVWKARTNIQHGLFPYNDYQLPPGWTRRDAVDVATFFLAYNQLKSYAEKLDFNSSRSNLEYPGRMTWITFIARNWNRWGVHELVLYRLKLSRIHPMVLVNQMGYDDVPWPDPKPYLPAVVDPIGKLLFGSPDFEVAVKGVGAPVRKLIRAIIQWSCGAICNRFSPRDVEDAAVLAVFDLSRGTLTKRKIASAIKAVAMFKKCTVAFKLGKEARRAEEMCGELYRIIERLPGTLIRQRPSAKFRDVQEVQPVTPKARTIQKIVPLPVKMVPVKMVQRIQTPVVKGVQESVTMYHHYRKADAVGASFEFRDFQRFAGSVTHLLLPQRPQRKNAPVTENCKIIDVLNEIGDIRAP